MAHVIPRQVLKLPEVLGDSQREDLVLDFTGWIHTLHEATRWDGGHFFWIPMGFAKLVAFQIISINISR